MARVDDILPKKVKFKKIKKSRGQTSRISISIPQSPYRQAYASAGLVRALNEMGYTRANIYTDDENELIAVEPTEDIEGFLFRSQRHYASGVQFSAKLGKALEPGRYVYQRDLSYEGVFVLRKLEGREHDIVKMTRRKR